MENYLLIIFHYKLCTDLTIYDKGQLQINLIYKKQIKSSLLSVKQNVTCAYVSLNPHVSTHNIMSYIHK